MIPILILGDAEVQRLVYFDRAWQRAANKYAGIAVQEMAEGREAVAIGALARAGKCYNRMKLAHDRVLARVAQIEKDQGAHQEH